MSVATQARELIRDADVLLKETYPLVKNPKLYVSALSSCKNAMSTMIVDLFQYDGITFDTIPTKFENYISDPVEKQNFKFVEGIKSHDLASSLLNSFSERQVDFYRDDNYYLVGENNVLTKISYDDVIGIIKSAMLLYELWYEKWKSH